MQPVGTSPEQEGKPTKGSDPRTTELAAAMYNARLIQNFRKFTQQQQIGCQEEVTESRRYCETQSEVKPEDQLTHSCTHCTLPLQL